MTTQFSHQVSQKTVCLVYYINKSHNQHIKFLADDLQQVVVVYCKQKGGWSSTTFTSVHDETTEYLYTVTNFLHEWGIIPVSKRSQRGPKIRKSPNTASNMAVTEARLNPSPPSALLEISGYISIYRAIEKDSRKNTAASPITVQYVSENTEEHTLMM